MQTEIVNTYKQFRQHAPFMLAGRNAELALSAAKTLITFRELEDQGLVRIEALPEEESYFSAFGEPDSEKERQRLIEILERDGYWYVVTEFFSPESEDWESADSIGMCAGYSDPTSPFENCYVIDMMQSAIDKLSAETSQVSS